MFVCAYVRSHVLYQGIIYIYISYPGCVVATLDVASLTRSRSTQTSHRPAAYKHTQQVDTRQSDYYYYYIGIMIIVIDVVVVFSRRAYLVGEHIYLLRNSNRVL